MSIPLSDAVHRSEQGRSKATPLVVNFESAILRTDLLHERIAAFVKSEPWMLPNLVLAASKSRAALDGFLIARADANPPLASYPRAPEVEHLVAEARKEGREIAWVSGEDLRVEAARGDMMELLDVAPEVYRLENSAETQAMALSRRFPQGFAYVGRSAADLPLWRAARERFGVGLSPELLRRTAAEGLGIVELSPRRSMVAALVRSLRPHQWLKNLLVFVPFALNYGQLHGRDIAHALLAFVCLCALTSGTYLVNDLFDVEADRRHPRKRRRPIASGDLPIATAALVSAILIVASLVAAALLRHVFAAALVSYLVITLAYSFRLKRMAMVDVLVIAMLFTLRILAGMLLTSEKPSHWLLMFSIFFFLSLAFMKREVEFNVMSQAGRSSLSGRGYDLDDRLYVLCCGLSSGIASIVIFSLFITETIERGPQNYNAPVLLWGVMGLLGYWVLRMWMLTTRGLMNDDPILFAARDRTSIMVGAACAVLAIAAQVMRF